MIKSLPTEHSLPLPMVLATAMRPKNALFPSIITASVLIASHQSAVVIIGSVLLVIIAEGIATLFNDLSDREIDLANRRHDIPLASGSMTPRQTAHALTILIIVCTSIAVLLGPIALLWLAASQVLGWLYSGYFGLKNKPFASLATLGLCYGVMPWLLAQGLAAAPFSTLQLIVVIASFIFTTGIVALKDYKDVHGDTKFGKRTLLVVKGNDFVKIFTTFCTATSFLTLILMTSSGIQVSTLFSVIGATASMMLLRALWQDNIPATRTLAGAWVRIIYFACALTVFIAN